MGKKLQTFAHITLDVQIPHNPITIGVQGDTGRWLDCYLTDNGKPIDLTGLKVRIMAIRPDQNIKQADQFTDGVITEPTNGRCQFEMKSNILGAAGYANVQVFIMEQENQRISTPIFQMQIQTSLYGASAVEGSNEYGAVVIMFQDFYEAKALMIQNIEQMEAISKKIGTEQDFSAIDPSAKNLAQALKTQYDMNKNALQNSSVSGVIAKLGKYTDQGNTTVFGKENNLITKTDNLLLRQPLFADKELNFYERAETFTMSQGQSKVLAFDDIGQYFYALEFPKDAELEYEITISGSSYVHKGVSASFNTVPDMVGFRKDGKFANLIDIYTTNGSVGAASNIAVDMWCGIYTKISRRISITVKNNGREVKTNKVKIYIAGIVQ